MGASSPADFGWLLDLDLDLDSLFDAGVRLLERDLDLDLERDLDLEGDLDFLLRGLCDLERDRERE